QLVRQLRPELLEKGEHLGTIDHAVARHGHVTRVLDESDDLVDAVHRIHRASPCLNFHPRGPARPSARDAAGFARPSWGLIHDAVRRGVAARRVGLTTVVESASATVVEGASAGLA